LKKVMKIAGARMEVPPEIARNTRLLVTATAILGAGVAFPFMLGEAAWAFALLVAPVLLLAVAALPVAIWSASRAVLATLHGDDPRRWVAVFSMGVLLVSLAMVWVLALRLFPRSV
jgi:hypothetical protein